MSALNHLHSLHEVLRRWCRSIGTPSLLVLGASGDFETEWEIIISNLGRFLETRFADAKVEVDLEMRNSEIELAIYADKGRFFITDGLSA